jgi:inosine-uridine nucleoside N-ribohydrolase
MQTVEKTPVLIYSDDGRDVDDIEAITYLAGSPNIEIAGIVTTHMIPDRRAMIARAVLNGLGKNDVPIGVGSIFTTGKEDETLLKYLREHTVRDRTYEGEGLIETFPDGMDLIEDLTDHYGDKLKIAVLAPMTDLAKVAERSPRLFKRIGGLFIQGQAVVEDATLSPDPAAYNLAEDMEAATHVFRFQDEIPFTMVGKHAAYQVPLLRSDSERMSATGNSVGMYMKTHAEKGIECFAERAPQIFTRVFGVMPNQVSQLNELSKPYDALVAMAIANPRGRIANHIGHHTLIGMTPEDTGVADAAELKRDLMNTMMRALTR